MQRYDVMIIGAGVTGSAIARELSRYKLKVAVLDKNSDVCEGTSKANSGIIHAGFDAKPGSLKARLNVRGSEMMPLLAEQLDIPFRRNGSMVVCEDERDLPELEKLYKRGLENGVKHMRLLSREEALEMEPNLSDKTVRVLYAETGGIVCPFNMTIAFAEHAFVNGVDFFLRTQVKEIIELGTDMSEYCTKGDSPSNAGYIIKAVKYDESDPDKDSIVIYHTKYVINAAGVHADIIHNMISDDKMTITPRKGEYCLLDISAGGHVHSTIFKMPGVLGKGILVSPTIHGNLLVGPTAQDLEDKEGNYTTMEGLAAVNKEGAAAVKNVPMREVITSFAGLRPHADRGDFIIEELTDHPGFIDAAGIESPGLSASPAIGELVREMIVSKEKPAKKENFIPGRKGITVMKFLSQEKQYEIIESDPRYANIICRCSSITEGEILETIHRPLGARTMDGVKRRTGANMGRCQGGFCYPKVMEILSRELGLPMESITKCGRGSEIIKGHIKDDWAVAGEAENSADTAATGAKSDGSLSLTAIQGGLDNE